MILAWVHRAPPSWPLYQLPQLLVDCHLVGYLIDLVHCACLRYVVYAWVFFMLYGCPVTVLHLLGNNLFLHHTSSID
jgi:hypothetical protein